jgi:prepilin-type N-terminal cleavage/methylation domain-containing protein
MALKTVNKRSFSLVELLVCMAIFALLGNLLMPALNNMMSSSRTLVCLKQQQSVSKFTTFYIEDNNDRFPFAGWWEYSISAEAENHPLYGVNWSDLLSSYDGRDLFAESAGTVFVKEDHYIRAEGLKDWSNFYLCPEDNETHAWGNGTELLGATYSYNNYASVDRGFITEYASK